MEDASDDELDDICGWGAANLDDELSGPTRPPPAAVHRKRRAQLPALRAAVRRQPAARLRLQRRPASPEAAAEADAAAARSSDHAGPRPRPKATASSEELAAAGRRRRQQLEAVHTVRQAAVVTIVSASLDLDEPEDRPVATVRPGRSVEPHAVEPPEPVAAVAAAAATSSLLSLPLLSIVPGCGGSAARLSGKYPLVGCGPRGRGPHRRKQRRASLPVSSVASEPAPPASASVGRAANAATTAFTVAVRVPPAPRRLDGDPADNLLLPVIPNPPAAGRVAVRPVVAAAVAADVREEVQCGQALDSDEDESWTRCYDDPELLATSMAGLIQALATFAASGRPNKPKKRRGRAKRTPHKRPKAEQEADGHV